MNKEVLPIFLLGADGKMGRMLQALIAKDPRFTLVDVPQAGAVIIDFSHPEATMALLDQALSLKCPMVIGTTGFDQRAMQKLKAASEAVPILCGSNMSEGVALMRKLVAMAASQLGLDADVEIIEKHHKHKVDAPSGTAISLGEVVARARQQDFDEAKVLSRSGETGARVPGSIGFATVRAGDIVGEHTVLFASEGEVLEIKHTSFHREHYAKGAMKAALWLKGQAPGLYGMDDVK